MPQSHAAVIAQRYRLVALVGEGGMGRVWAARDELLGRDVAVKELVLPRGLTEAEQEDLRVRVIREARAIARLDHPNVVRVFDVVHERGEPWIVMELVPSRSLFDMVSTDGPMPPVRVAEIGLGVLAALRAAHQAGLLHRDVKPGNVLLGSNGRVVLTDFGLATAAGDSSMTSTGVVLGSPSYLAPERALDDPIGPAADLWSLGATLYTAVEGRPPYSKSSPMATLAALASEPPRPPQQAGVLKPALDALLQKDPARRAGAATADTLLRAALTGPSPRRAGFPVKKAGLIAAAAIIVAAGAFALRPLVFDRADAQRGPAFIPSPALAPEARPSPSTIPPSAAVAPVPSVPPATPRPAAPKPSTAKPPVSKPTKTKPVAPPATAGAPIENMQTGTCLHLPAGGGTLQLWACDSSDGQKFSFAADGSMRVLGKCVQVQNTGDGAGLIAATCSGAATQKFRYESAYDLVSVAAEKCVDVPAGDGNNGVPAQLWSCNGTGNQKWRH
ncbi:protein kinase [Actinoplanes sp. NPDC051470]|uniref:protein kinase domain-containing protein n=1 Tax=Actinoplanes sp. NPDC051470 TaxID=3157224 RepID=UPI0034170651